MARKRHTTYAVRLAITRYWDGVPVNDSYFFGNPSDLILSEVETPFEAVQIMDAARAGVNLLQSVKKIKRRR